MNTFLLQLNVTDVLGEFLPVCDLPVHCLVEAYNEL